VPLFVLYAIFSPAHGLIGRTPHAYYTTEAKCAAMADQLNRIADRNQDWVCLPATDAFKDAKK
jgi:hypothetical protein